MRKDRDVLTTDEIGELLATCNTRSPSGARDHALLTLLWRTGLRISEALALKVKDLDCNTGLVRVHHGKGDKARVAGLDQVALRSLERWLAKRKALGLNGRQPVFCTISDGKTLKKGSKLNDANCRQMLARRVTRTEIEKRVHLHGFRHAHAMELMQEGVPVPLISRVLGHSSLAVTDHYLRGLHDQDVIDLHRGRTAATDSSVGLAEGTR